MSEEFPQPSPTDLLGAFTETAMLVSSLEQNTQNFHSQMVIKGIVSELVNKVELIKKEFGIDGGIAVTSEESPITAEMNEEILKNTHNFDEKFHERSITEVKGVGNKRILLN